MTKIADEKFLMTRAGTGWMETWAEEGKMEDLSICAWVQGFILTEGGNLICLREIAENYNSRKDGWGFRIWMISKPSMRQMKEAPWATD